MRRVLTVSLVVCLASVLHAQQAGAPQFDVVSIKPNVSGAVASSLRPDTNGVVGVNINALRLFRVGYQVPNFQIVGAPDWFGTERFDVTARAGRTVAVADLAAMIKSLLADRFGVQVSHEPRPVSGYELRVDRGGASLRRAARPCATARMDQPRATGQEMPCFRATDGELIARGVTLRMLAQELQGWLGQPVVDATTDDHLYDFDLAWTPDPGTGTTVDTPSVSLFTAVREQLGLRLVPARPVVDVYVITAAHRPEAN